MKKLNFKFTVKNIIVLSLVAVLLLTLLLTGLLLKIGHVNVTISTGYGYITTSQVEQCLGIEDNSRLLTVMNKYKSLWFFMDTKDLESKCLENFIYADSVKCTVDGKDINIVVNECLPVVYVACGEMYLLMDSKGKILEAHDEMKLDYPLYGGKVDNFSLGGYIQIAESELKTINRIRTAFDNTDLHREVLGRINKFSIQKTGDIIMMTSDGITINMGPVDDIEENLFTLKEILVEYLCKDQVGYLDFTTGGDPVFTEYK